MLDQVKTIRSFQEPRPTQIRPTTGDRQLPLGVRKQFCPWGSSTPVCKPHAEHRAGNGQQEKSGGEPKPPGKGALPDSRSSSGQQQHARSNLKERKSCRTTYHVASETYQGGTAECPRTTANMTLLLVIAGRPLRNPLPVRIIACSRGTGRAPTERDRTDRTPEGRNSKSPKQRPDPGTTSRLVSEERKGLTHIA